MDVAKYVGHGWGCAAMGNTALLTNLWTPRQALYMIIVKLTISSLFRIFFKKKHKKKFPFQTLLSIII